MGACCSSTDKKICSKPHPHSEAYTLVKYDNNEEEVTKACLKLDKAEENNKNVHADAKDADVREVHQLPTELHAELMHFLDMGSLRKMLPVSRLPYALFGNKMRKWDVRNEWVYPTKKPADETRQQHIFVISQHGLGVCKGNAHVFANVLAKNPFQLMEPTADNTSAPAVATTVLRRFYFEIHVNKTTGPILFGLVERRFRVDTSWKWRMECADRAERVRAQRHPEEHHWHSMWRVNPCFLAEDVAAWPPTPIDWEWDDSGFFAQKSFVHADGKFADGDVLGCGLLVFPRMPMQEVAPLCFDTPLKHQLFFTRNGQLFGEPTWVSPIVMNCSRFPFVCLTSAGTSVSANFGDFDKVPFAYNIGQHNGPIGTE